MWEQRSNMRRGARGRLSLSWPKCLSPSPRTAFLSPTRGPPGQSLWKPPEPPAPLSCARGPLGGRKQCIVTLASRISCSGPGAERVFVKTLPREPWLPGQGQTQEECLLWGLEERALQEVNALCLLGRGALWSPIRQPPGSG